MIWLLVLSVSLIIVGSALSVLRDSQTIDYCNTIVQDGRNDEYAKNVMALYKSGLVMAGIGLCMLVIITIMMAIE